jgi:hypothetical protein
VELINTATKSADVERQQKAIELLPSTKIRQLRQAIKDDLGIKDKVSMKLYLPKSEEPPKTVSEDQEEVKEGEY